MLSCFVEISALNAKSVDTDQTPHSVESDLHCLPMSLLWDARHKWVNLQTPLCTHICSMQEYHLFFLFISRNKLILEVARHCGYSKVMLGNCGSQLAVQLLTDMAIGRGSHAAMEAVSYK